MEENKDTSANVEEGKDVVDNDVVEIKPVKSLGELIGLVSHVFSITNDAGDKVQLNINIDFTGASSQDIKGWLVSNRIIAGQRPWRKLGKGELESLGGRSFAAESIGRKIKERGKRGRSEKIEDLIDAGIPEDLAGFAVDNPEGFKEIMKGMKKKK